MKKTDCEIKQINKGTAEYFLMQHHHLSQQGNSVRSGVRYFGLYGETELIGVMIFNTMSSQNTAKGCFGLSTTDQSGFYEIGRFAVAITPDPDGCGTWFFSECVKRFCREFNVRALFGYIDPNLEDGTYFLENGFECYGLTPKRSDFYEKLEDGSYLKCRRGKPSGVAGEWRPRPQKHRLLRVIDEELSPCWGKTDYPVTP